MPTSIGNLAIIISGNARPFQNTMNNVKNQINQWSAGTQNFINIKNGSSLTGGLRYTSLGRFAQSAFVKALGGGLIGAIGGVFAGMGMEIIRSGLNTFAEIGRHAAMFLADSFQEGLKLSRMEMGVNFLAGNKDRGADWMNQIRSLSAASGFDMVSLGQSMRTLAGSTDDLNSVVPTLRAIAEISAGIGAESDQMNRFALAVAQVTSAGRFEAQELNQLTEAGMPIKELAKTAKMTTGEFRAAVKDGAVSVTILAETFNRLVGPGGKFFGMLEERAKTAVGQFDAMSAKWMMFKQELGKGLLEGMNASGTLDALKNGVDYLLKNKNEISKFVTDVWFGIRHWSVQLVMFAGNVYDVFQVMREVVVEMMRMHRVFMAITTGGMSEIARLASDGILPAMDNLFAMMDMGTGRRWAAEFEKMFSPNRSAVEPFNPMPQLPETLQMTARLAKKLEEIRGQMSGMADGANPFAKFKAGLADMDAYYKFFEAKTVEQRALAQDLFGAANPLLNNQTDQLMQAQKAFNATLDRAKGLDPNSRNADAHFMEAMRQKREMESMGAGGITGMVGNLLLDAGMAKWKQQGFGKGEEDMLLYNNFVALEKSLSATMEKFPAAMSKGSQEAASAITHAMYGGTTGTIQERMLAVMKASKEKQDAEAADIKAVADFFRAKKGKGLFADILEGL